MRAHWYLHEPAYEYAVAPMYFSLRYPSMTSDARHIPKARVAVLLYIRSQETYIIDIIAVVWNRDKTTLFATLKITSIFLKLCVLWHLSKTYLNYTCLRAKEGNIYARIILC